MKHRALNFLISAIAAVVSLCVCPVTADIAQTPLNLVHSVPPRILFAMSNDHALYYKAYTDWNDLDGDGATDTTYLSSFSYYGYFDPAKCYEYENGRFVPKGGTKASFYCEGQWSGNFLNWATMSRMDIVRKVLYGGYRSTDTADETVLERAFIPTDAHSFAKYYAGEDIRSLTPFDVADLTLCNTTYAATGQSQNVTASPRIRVVEGDFRYWAANERWQCTWDDERGDNSSGTNYTGSDTSDPGKDTNGLGEKDYVARVQVCVPGLLGTEEKECRNYKDGNPKPVGLLHEYGENEQLLFGLMTGSYAKNKSGGVLRKNISSFKNEVNVDTDGTFTGSPGIVKTLNNLRIARYDYADGTYNTADSCPWGLASFPDGQCSNWGNPLSEIYLESLRYLAGLSPATAYAANDSGYVAGLSTPDWVDPLDEEHWCAHCNIILINASESSYDHDSLDPGGLKNSPDAVDWTNKLGDLEGISGLDYFVGENGSDNNQLCTAKKVPGLGGIRGACPGAPRLSGTYLVTGLAYWAKTKDIRGDLDEDQHVTTRAVALLPGVPRLVIPIPDREDSGSSGTVSILPACRIPRLDGTTDTNCAIVDFKILEQDIVKGTGIAYVNWEDSEQGGDYDQDMKGTISYAINAGAGTITVTTDTDEESTIYPMGFGYVISGTDLDGFHVHSGSEGFSYSDPTGVIGCDGCEIDDIPSSYTYRLGQSSAGLLEQPLWYAAKYGSFNDGNKNDEPDQEPEWDEDRNGRPDGFFLANDPSKLGPALARFLDVISATTSSASVATNSVTLNTDTQIYQGRFDSGDWSGDLVAFPVDDNGSIGTPAWHSRDQVNEQAQSDTRRIVTTNESSLDGVPFRWDQLADAQKRALQCLTPPCADADLATDPVGQDRLDYVRGSDNDELQNGGDMRDREYKLGDIADSEPIYVGAPASLYPDDIEAESYLAFASASDATNRAHVLYVGANDGMLHGFDATTGAELFGYVPRAVYPNLPRLTTLNYRDNHRYFVNGGPTVADVYIGSEWRTVLVGGLAAGGAGVFAIDVTDPERLKASESSAADLVLWDITGADTGFGDLGFTFSKPAVVRMPDGTFGGKWVAIFGNGYHDDPLDTRGKAVLYFVDVADGTLLGSVVAQSGPGNGLSSVAPVDYDGDAKVDYIYAGDLKGNLWRFEPNGASAWKVSFGGAPLFMNGTPDVTTTETLPTEVCTTKTEQVCVRTKKGKCVAWKDVTNVVCHWEDMESTTVTPGEYQPITVRPEVIRHSLGGVMVLFGTGSFYRDGEGIPKTDVTNAFYGVWDRLRTDETGEIRTQHLLGQRIVEETNLNGFDLRVTTGNPIKWHTDTGKPTDFPPSTQLGWYLELLKPDGTGQGELQVTDPLVRGGRVIFTTMIPSPAACDFGGDGWLMELDALTGRPMPEPVFDLDGDGLFTDADLVEVDINGETVKVAPTGKKSKVGVIQEPAVIAAGTKEYKFNSGAKDAGIEVTTENPGELAGGRRSWLQLH